MDISIDLQKQAQLFPFDKKRDYLLSFSETELHRHLKCLIEKMEEGSLVEITHGRDEHGRDLVVKKHDVFGESFAGVIVKKCDPTGKITGKSAGVIDDIISQVNQAFSHPCFLREIEVGSVRISEVWVVFFGSLTGNASQRVEFELKTFPLRLFALGWLIKKFEDFYPEFFFDASLASFIQEKITELEIKRDFPRKIESLSAMYIEPWVCEAEAFTQLDEEIIRVLKEKKLPFSKLEETIQPGKNILLVGDPGTGKSTALTKIALDMMRRNFQILAEKGISAKTPMEVPILIKATDFLRYDNCDSLLDTYFPEPSLRGKVKIRVLMIDGIDELKAPSRAEVSKKSAEFCRETGCGLVISSRKVEAARHVLLPFQQYELLPFDYNQAITLVERIVNDETVLDIIREGLRSDELKLIFTPLTLHLLVDIVKAEREIPASLAEVFDQFTDLAFGRLDISRGIESVFVYIVKKTFLAELAWAEFGQKERLKIPREDFDAFVENYMGIYSWDRDKFEQFISEIERAGILRIGDELVFFRHRSFLDYFMALWVSEHREEIHDLDNEMVNLYFNDFWTDVAFFYIGIRRRITQAIVDGIANYCGEAFETEILKVLIGRLLQAGWNTPTEIKKQAIRVGVTNFEPIHSHLVKLLESQEKRVPLIIADLFVLALSQYSFFSRTLSREALTVANELIEEKTSDALMKSLALFWANRNIVDTADAREYVAKALDTSAQLEQERKLSIHDKYVSLFLLQQIKHEDKNLLKSARRKLARVRLQYSTQISHLLPVPKTGFRKKKKS